MHPADLPSWVTYREGGSSDWWAELPTDGSGLRVTLGPGIPDVGVAGRGELRCLVQGFAYGLPPAGSPVRSPVDGDSLADRLLAAYQVSGAGLVDQLKGFFGLLIWDGRRQTLLAVRDPLGVHPLFNARTSDALLLSPWIRTLRSRPGVSKAVNRAAVADHLRHLWPRPTETYFEGIHRVEPGHVLTVAGGSTTTERYWDPLFPGRRPEWVDEADLEQFDVLLEQSVARVLDLGPSGIYLSGGLDSVAVGALAADRTRRQDQPPPLALSLVFPEPYSERNTQAGVAGQLGIPQLFTDLDDALGPGGLVAAAVRGAGLSAPMQNPWLPAYRSMARRARAEGRDVILTGSGGDEWLTVTPMYAADLLRAGRLGQLLALARAQRRSYDVSPWLLTRNMVWRFGGRPLLARERELAMRRLAPNRLVARRMATRRAGLERRPWLAPDPALRREMVDRDAEHVRRQLEETELLPIGGPQTYFRECREALTHPLVSMEAEEVFEYSRAVGVRVLHPYGDTRLVEFLHATPPALLNSGGRSKGLIRAMLARRFPDLGFERQRKTITASYFGRSVVAQAPGVWAELGGAQALADAGIVDPDRSAQLYAPGVESATSTPHNAKTDPMWELLTIETWLRAHS